MQLYTLRAFFLESYIVRLHNKDGANVFLGEGVSISFFTHLSCIWSYRMGSPLLEGLLYLCLMGKKYLLSLLRSRILNEV